MRRREKVALTVVTGFLGSGKTTLLRRALAGAASDEFAVVVNEAADSGVDADLLRGLCARAVHVTGGCACCERRDELITALKEIYGAFESGEIARLKQVVVETSGLADPLPIVAAIAADPVLRHHFEVRSVVTVVDAVEGAGVLDYPEARRQVVGADRLLISKSDLVPDAMVNDLRTALVATGIVAPIELTAGAWSDLFAAATSVALHDQTRVDVPGGHAHAPVVSTTSMTFDRPVDWVAFGVWLSLLLHAHGRRVLRVKGIVPTTGAGSIAINSVRHMLYPPEHVDGLREGEAPRLVVIADQLDTKSIRRSLDAFQAIA